MIILPRLQQNPSRPNRFLLSTNNRTLFDLRWKFCWWEIDITIKSHNQGNSDSFNLFNWNWETYLLFRQQARMDNLYFLQKLIWVDALDWQRQLFTFLPSFSHHQKARQCSLQKQHTYPVQLSWLCCYASNFGGSSHSPHGTITWTSCWRHYLSRDRADGSDG